MIKIALIALSVISGGLWASKCTINNSSAQVEVVR